MSDKTKTKTKQAKAKKAEKFITLPNGALVRRSAVMAVEMYAGEPGKTPKAGWAMKPFVTVTYAPGEASGWVTVSCESNAEARGLVALLGVILG